jgi:hypothetical protein
VNKEKKQLVAIGVLALMVVSVGAFQFIGGSAEPPKAEEKKKPVAQKKESSAEIAKAAIKNPDFANPLAVRDPFEVSNFAYTEDPADKKEGAGDEAEKPIPKANAKPSVKHGHSDFQPAPLPGNTLPAGGIKPVEPPKPKFEYSLIGIVSGTSPSAVFSDPAGNQRMVDLGQSVGDGTVVSITRNFVKVRFNNETLVLKVGGNPNAK